MVFRNKYTGKINWIPLLGTIAGGLFLIVLLTVILSEVFRGDPVQSTATSSGSGSMIAQPITDISYSEASDGSMVIDNYPEYAKDEKKLTELATHVLEVWRGYTDESAFIFAETDGEPHNTITPIARRSGDMFELDLTLRNNITTDEHPLGVYHPHAEYHHIKKENIGLIEVMGLAVLPARLKEELELLAEYILEGKDISSNEKIEKHAAWVAEFLPKYDNLDKDNIQDVLRKEVGNVFVHVLEDAGVYKCTAEGREAFMRFINKL